MTLARKRVALAAAVGALLALAGAPAAGALQTIENPGGGKIVYGQVAGQTTEAGAMAAVLRSVHAQCSDRPQVGKLFQVRGTSSVAVFFTATNHANGDAPLAGLVIVAQPAPDRIEAALLTDDAARFGSSVNPMLKTLFGVWHPVAAAPPPGAPSASAPPAALHQVSLPDNSASVSLPSGWNVAPSSGGGTIIASGPNGEAALLDYPFLAMNSSDPRVQRTMQFAQGAGRNTSYARALYYPYGGDLAKTFVDLIQMTRQRANLPPATFRIAQETPVPAPPGSRCAHLTGQLDAQDGKGPKEMNSVFCSGALSPMGQFMNLAFHTAVPVAVADRERATMGAILASFSVNESVVQAQARAISAPAIAAIHEIGRRAAQQAADAHAAEDRQRQSVEQRWDSRDKSNQAFSNYLLDQTVIDDNQNNAHGTVWNQTADALVRSDPQRFGYVNTPDYWKGVDY